LLPLTLLYVADETYPVSGCPSVGVTLGRWTAWLATCGYAERTRTVSRCSVHYPASYIPSPVGYYDAECYVTCEINQEEEDINGAACPICTRGVSIDLRFLTFVFADVAPTSKLSNNYGRNYGSNYNSESCSTLPCGLGFSCLNLQGGQYTCLATSSADGDSQGTTTASPSSSGLSSVHVAVIAGLLTLSVMHDHVVHHLSCSRLRVP
jgi:hypothetical protein